MWGDQGYCGQGEVIRECAPRAQDYTHRRYRYHGRVNEVERAKNRNKSRIRSKVEHVFGVMKLEVWLREGALPRVEKERQSAVCHLRSGEPVHRTQGAVATSIGVIAG